MTLLLTILVKVTHLFGSSSKIIFIFLSFWYLFQHRLFSISFNLPYIKNIWLLNKVVYFMETLGVGIIIIPLVIVIMSFFMSLKP